MNFIGQGGARSKSALFLCVRTGAHTLAHSLTHAHHTHTICLGNLHHILGNMLGGRHHHQHYNAENYETGNYFIGQSNKLGFFGGRRGLKVCVWVCVCSCGGEHTPNTTTTKQNGHTARAMRTRAQQQQHFQLDDAPATDENGELCATLLGPRIAGERPFRTLCCVCVRV